MWDPLDVRVRINDMSLGLNHTEALRKHFSFLFEVSPKLLFCNDLLRYYFSIGTSGENPEPGEMGTPGLDGAPGQPGIKGQKGVIGNFGDDGLPGVRGPIGDERQGRKGSPGLPGNSFPSDSYKIVSIDETVLYFDVLQSSSYFERIINPWSARNARCSWY